jgi:hypothetical protein
MPLQLLTLGLSLIPQAIEVAKQGSAAWREFMASRKITGEDALNAQLDFLAEDFIRIKLIADYEASH